LRTRVSFDVAAYQLGGYSIMLAPNEVDMGKRESVADVARVISGYVQAVMLRVFDHRQLLEFARHSTVPVINGLSDQHHPCQALADMLTIYEKFGKIQGLKIAFVGDGNNVAASLLLASAQLGARFAIATPPGYELSQEVYQQAVTLAAGSSTLIESFSDPQRAVRDADVIYTDTWVSMGQEAEAAQRADRFKPYQVNDALVALANPNAVVMHCLPAHRGEEITDSVADGKQSVIFQQAHNRLHAQKAILAKLMA